jgi:hypothetical protein
MLASATLLALWGVIIVARRRAARRAAEAAEARARARRRPIPVVSSNLRGQPARGPDRVRDLWAETAAGSPRPDPVTPLTSAGTDG